MKLKKELLEKMQAHYASFKNAENVNELYENEMTELFNSVTTFNREDNYAKALAIAAAKYESIVKEGFNPEKELKEMAATLPGYTQELEGVQIEKLLRYRNDLDKIESISKDGEVETEDEEIQKQEEEGPKVEDSFEQRWQNADNEIEFESDLKEDPRVARMVSVAAHVAVTNVANPDKSVCFDYKFFNEMLEEKDAMQARINDKDFLFADMAKDELDFAPVPEDADAKQIARADAATRLRTYMTLEKRSQGRSFLDILKHPINSFNEWRTKKNLEKDINKRYGLSKETLDKMTGMVLDTKHPKNPETGYEEMEKDFLFVAKNGETVGMKTHTEKDVYNIASRDFPEDTNYDKAMNERREQEVKLNKEAEEEDIDLTQLNADVDLEKTESREKSAFAEKGKPAINAQEKTENAPKEVQ